MPSQHELDRTRTHPFLYSLGLQPSAIWTFGMGYCTTGPLAVRVAIPIHSATGELLAYAGYRLTASMATDKPRYLAIKNFRKSSELFNLHRAVNQHGSEPLTIVESIFDCIHLWHQGVRRVAALMGSNISPRQADLLVEHTRGERIILMFYQPEQLLAGSNRGTISQLMSRVFVKLVKLSPPWVPVYR